MRLLLAIGLSVFMVFTISQAGDGPKNAKNKGAKQVELTGQLRTGIFAIGGETTGTIIQTNQGTFELEFGKQKQLRQRAEKFNGKTVIVTGILEIRKGVEVKERRIVTVTSLEEAKGK